MPVMIFDEKKFELVIRCKPGESFTPDEEVNKLVKEFDALKKEYSEVTQRLTQFLPKCTDWSRKHDKILDDKLRAKEEQSKKTKPEEATVNGEAQI